jgi:hypothetical protein
METRQMTIDVPGDEPALLILPQPMTPDSVCRVELAITDVMSTLRRELDEHAAECGRLEYESWIGLLRNPRR